MASNAGIVVANAEGWGGTEARGAGADDWPAVREEKDDSALLAAEVFSSAAFRFSATSRGVRVVAAGSSSVGVAAGAGLPHGIGSDGGCNGVCGWRSVPLRARSGIIDNALNVLPELVFGVAGSRDRGFEGSRWLRRCRQRWRKIGDSR